MSGRSSPSGRCSPAGERAGGGDGAALPLLRVCGVPEHFNLPWTLGVKKRAFEDVAHVRWTAVPGGTGAMVSAVADGQQDVALALTEGIVAAALASRGGAEPLCYAGSYVTSPLCWMVVCASGREDAPASLAELGARAAGGECIRVSVSRLGSGSHIMAYLLAMREGWPLRNLVFVKNENFRNMRKALSDGTADIFMWEKFMTKPFVDQGELRTLGYLDSPWHCFGLLARRSWLEVEGHRQLLRAVVERALQQAAAFVQARDDSANDINAHFDIPLQDALLWLDSVRFAAPGYALATPAPMLRLVIEVLVAAGLVPDRAYALASDVCDECCALLDGAAPGAAAAKAGAGAGARARAGAPPWWASLMKSSATQQALDRAAEAEAAAASSSSSSSGGGGGGGAGGARAAAAAAAAPASPAAPAASSPFSRDAFTTRLRGDSVLQLGAAHRVLDLQSGSPSGSGASSLNTSASSASGGGVIGVPGLTAAAAAGGGSGIHEALGAPPPAPPADAQRVIPRRQSLSPEESMRERTQRAGLLAEKRSALELYMSHLGSFGGVCAVGAAGGSGAQRAPRRSSVRAAHTASGGGGSGGGGGGGGGSSSSSSSNSGSGSGGTGGGGGELAEVSFHDVSRSLARAGEAAGAPSGGGSSGWQRWSGGEAGTGQQRDDSSLPWHTRTNLSVDFG